MNGPLSRIGRAFRGPGSREWIAFLAAFWPFLLGSALVAGGLAAILIGWLGASGVNAVWRQIPYVISGGFLGLALVLFGSALVIAHALNRQSRLLRRMLEETRRRDAGAARGGDDGASGVRGSADGIVLVAAGATIFHRPGCALIEGKQARRLRPETAQRKGLGPCALCDPLVPA